jgi:hypothetical protein
MSDSGQQHLEGIVEEFQQALGDCEHLYITSAQECARLHPELVDDSRRDFLHRMVDLHRGLILKIFLAIAFVDRHWSHEDIVLAGAMFEHLWGRRLNDNQIRQSLNHFLEQSSLTWDVLLGPFDRLESFRQRIDEIQTVVLRIANLVAKADGRLSADEARQLQWIQSELKRVLVRLPLAGDEPKESVKPVGAQQLKEKPFELSSPSLPESLKPRTVVQLEPATPQQVLDDALAELDGLIGLGSIKEEVRGLINFLKMEKAREQFGLPQTQIALHSVFTGNPGTGKTTVARLLGRLFGAMGILPRGHLIETDRSGLVAEYAGQTAPKAHKKIDEALDGVLFIDEAYSLVAERGDDPYGAEALQVLLKRMEDNRDRLVVVLAGYPQPMDRLLKSNPGLSSRFSRHFRFPDYTAGELGHIFQSLCVKNRYELPVLTRVKLLLGFEYLLARRDEHFGNGRLARNIFEQAIGRLANRITGIVPLTRELLVILEAGDIVMEEVPASVWQDLSSDQRCFQGFCPSCKKCSPYSQNLLGRQVQCSGCHSSFVFDWGEVVRPNQL